MVKVPKLNYTYIIKREKYRNIKDLDKYKKNIQEGIFKKYQVEVKRLENKNFLKKWFNDYQYKKDLVTYKDSSWIIVKFDIPESEKLALALANKFMPTLRQELRI